MTQNAISGKDGKKCQKWHKVTQSVQILSANPNYYLTLPPFSLTVLLFFSISNLDNFSNLHNQPLWSSVLEFQQTIYLFIYSFLYVANPVFSGTIICFYIWLLRLLVCTFSNTLSTLIRYSEPQSNILSGPFSLDDTILSTCSI